MKHRILIADDDESGRSGLAALLTMWGYEVQEAVDGKDALQKLASTKVDMLITDLNMPNLDGIGLIKGARALASCKFIPIVMLTTESQDSKKQEGKAAGATGWSGWAVSGSRISARPSRCTASSARRLAADPRWLARRLGIAGRRGRAGGTPSPEHAASRCGAPSRAGHEMGAPRVADPQKPRFRGRRAPRPAPPPAWAGSLAP